MSTPILASAGVANREEAGATVGSMSDVDVLILGAGIAGITAAKTLSDGGVANLLILEAQEVIGGRVKSSVLPSGVRVELGANWIHGIDPTQPEKHPLWRIAADCGGLEGRYSEDIVHVFDEDGKNITDSDTFKTRLAEWNKIVDPGLDSYAKKRKDSNLPDMSAREALQRIGWTPSSPLDNLIEVYEFDSEYATSPEHASLHDNFPNCTYFDFGNPNNTANYFVTDQKEGFVKVVNCLAKSFLQEDDHRLHLGSTVVEVDWSGSQCVCVTTRESGKLQKYCARDAIITFSVGVLKSNAVKFIPELPASKMNAIETLDMVLYLKIFLEFNEVFWKDDTNCILRVDSTRGRFILFLTLTETTPLLFTVVTGEVAKAVYGQSKEETTAQIMKGLRTIYGDDIPDPLSVTIPDWWVNPLFRGTYSSVPTSGESAIEMLREAVGRLHFSGEATNEKYSGYVHGGYFSGITAAQEVLQSTSTAQ